MYQGEGLNLLDVRDLQMIYGKKGFQTHALNDISMYVQKGEYVAIIGKSGCGKSTLLSIIAGIQKPTSGKVMYKGQDIYLYSDSQLAKYRNKEIGFVVQQFALINEYSVEKNVMLPMRYSLLDTKERKRKAAYVLKRMGIYEKKDKFPYELSGGECQRVAIARALINNPGVLLADEPTGALDEENGKNVMQIFDELHSDGNTIIIVTHDMDIAKRADRIITMCDGRIVEK